MKSSLLVILNTLGVVVLLGSTASVHATELSDGRDVLTIIDIQRELDSVPSDVRASMSRDQMARFISNVLIDRRMEKAAISAGTVDIPAVQASMARASRDQLVRAFSDVEAKKLGQSLPDLVGLAQERYEVNKSSYVIPEAVRLAHILLRVNEEDPIFSDEAVRVKAEKILNDLRAGADFGELAKSYSEDLGSGKRNGELPGWSEKGKLVPPFERAAFALNLGEVSGLVRTRFGYHIIKLLEKREARQQTFEEVKEQLLATVRNEYLNTKRMEWNKTFHGSKPIELDDTTLEILKKP